MIRRRAEAGFTLVELLVAVLIFGVLSAAGVALLSTSARSQAISAERLQDVAALRRVSALLAADLAAAVPRITREEAGTRRPAFVGHAAGEAVPLIGFVRSGWSNLDAAPRPSLQKVDYRFADGRLERVAYPLLDGTAPGTPSLLIGDIESIGVRYRARDGWVARWDPFGAEPMPRAVELVIQPRGGPAVRQLFLVGGGP